MFLKDFNQKGSQRIAKVNKMLKEEFNVSLKTAGFPSKKKLDKLAEQADAYLSKIKNVNGKFQLEPEYAKYLGIKDVIATMISEGMYAESPKYKEMKEMINASVRELMDSGYTQEEACTECMNRFRMDNRFAYDDEHVLPIVITAAKNYMEACSDVSYESVEEDAVSPETDLSEYLLRELAKECRVELSDQGSYDTIEEKLNMFAEVSGKTRDAVVGFLNGLDESQLLAGIQMFGAKVAEANKFVKARKDAIASGKKDFEVDGKKYKVTGDTSDELEESMFDDIIGDMLNEEVDVEQAEVIMAVRALADDIQGHVEEIGRMMNESVPAIADQMRGEMGAQTAQAFADSVNGVLSAYIEAAKSAKAGVDQATNTVTGEQAVATDDLGLGDTAELGEPEAGLEEPAVDVNEPAAAGPEEEPLGRTPVEI